MNISELKNISSVIENYSYICNKPNKDNNIEIRNNTIYLIEHGKTIMEKFIDITELRNKLSQTVYQKNIFKKEDAIFNPLEADRKENKFVWKNNYNKINFPKFIPVVLFSLLVNGEIPSIVDFSKIYMLTYTENIPPNEITDKRLSLYDGIYINDRERVGKVITFSDGQQMNNKLIRFKEKYSDYVYGLPINEFTTEHICSRIYKVYGSVVRDVYNALYFSSFGVNTYYSLLDDLLGIDLFLNDIPVFAYTDTVGGQEFREKKITERHPELNQKIGLKLEKDIYNERIGGLYLIGDNTIHKIIDILNNGVNDIVKISF